MITEAQRPKDGMKTIQQMAEEAGFTIHKPTSIEAWAPFIGAGDFGEVVCIEVELERFAALIRAQVLEEYASFLQSCGEPVAAIILRKSKA